MLVGTLITDVSRGPYPDSFEAIETSSPRPLGLRFSFPAFGIFSMMEENVNFILLLIDSVETSLDRPLDIGFPDLVAENFHAGTWLGVGVLDRGTLVVELARLWDAREGGALLTSKVLIRRVGCAELASAELALAASWVARVTC
jgi:hypothetical protein